MKIIIIILLAIIAILTTLGFKYKQIADKYGEGLKFSEILPLPGAKVRTDDEVIYDNYKQVIEFLRNMRKEQFLAEVKRQDLNFNYYAVELWYMDVMLKYSFDDCKRLKYMPRNTFTHNVKGVRNEIKRK